MKNYIVAYDVFNLKRLQKVRKIAYSYALGGQKSAVEAPLCKKDIKALYAQLEAILQREDKLNIIRIKGQPILLGRAKSVEFEEGLIIV